MAGQKAREYNRLQKLDTGYLQSFYGRSRRRLLVFDYDGTLVAHHALAQLSAPPPGLLQVLEALCEVWNGTAGASACSVAIWVLALLLPWPELLAWLVI